MSIRKASNEHVSGNYYSKIVAERGVNVFATTAERDAVIKNPTEGLMVYIQDLDDVLVYSGSAWGKVGGAAFYQASAPTGLGAGDTGTIWIDSDEVASQLNTNDFLTIYGGNTITSQTAGAVTLTLKGASGQTANYLTIADSTNTARVVVDKDGDIGVGVASPAYKVDVSGTVNASAYYLNGALFRGGATGGSTDAVFYENDQVVTTNYTITAGKNAGTFGPVTINSGVTVTIPSGSVWTVI